jgi:hypothetical protein
MERARVEAQNTDTNGDDDDGFVPVPLPDGGDDASEGVKDSQLAAWVPESCPPVLNKDPCLKSQPDDSRGHASGMPAPTATGRDYGSKDAGAMQVDDLIASDGEDAAGSDWEAELEPAGGQAQEVVAAPVAGIASTGAKGASSAAKGRDNRYELLPVAQTDGGALSLR